MDEILWRSHRTENIDMKQWKQCHIFPEIDMKTIWYLSWNMCWHSEYTPHQVLPKEAVKVRKPNCVIYTVSFSSFFLPSFPSFSILSFLLSPSLSTLTTPSLPSFLFLVFSVDHFSQHRTNKSFQLHRLSTL